MPRRDSPSVVSAAVIAEHCRELRLPTIAGEYLAAARQALDGDWSYESYLQELLEREVLKRRQNVAAKRLKEARFPDTKTLDQIDWDALRGVQSRFSTSDVALLLANCPAQYSRLHVTAKVYAEPTQLVNARFGGLRTN
jgi:DNA replication protein DnaC